MEGYAQLAWRMANHTDLGILRRFAPLNVQNLLYLQAELTDLETKLRNLEKANAASGEEPRKWYSRDWRFLAESQETEGNGGSQWLVFLEIRAKLREYSKRTGRES